MAKKMINRISAVALSGVLAVPVMQAVEGAPHTVTCDDVFSEVTLEWKSPETAKTLQWHDDYAYNGDTGVSNDPQKPVTFYVSAFFDVEDLKPWVGEKVKSITMFQYRPVYQATVLVYEDEKVVAQADVDPSKFEKDTSLEVALPESITISEGKTYRFAIKYVCGENCDLAANKDRYSNPNGKGDLFSYDGEHWTSLGSGDYIITANIESGVDEAPDGYNVYSGGVKLNDALITDTKFVMTDVADGKHSYTVAAVYGDKELMSKPVDVTVRGLASYYPTVTFTSAKVDSLKVDMAWAAPLLGGNELTWSDKVNSLSIGGTQSTNTRVWVKNEFTSNDLVAYVGSKISAINFMFTEATVTGITAYVMRDGVIVYSEEAADTVVSSIKAGEWTKIPLSEPFEIKQGHDYAYGLFVYHKTKTHPIGVGGGVTINVKGNSFSSSSASSTFNNSKPTWKTLHEGGIEGNWMMTADMEGSSAPLAAPSYDLYRNGELVKADLTVDSVRDEVADLGKYIYSIVAKSGDRTSAHSEVEVNVALPSAYSAPLIENSSFDRDTKEVKISWNMDKELTHSGDPKYVAAFDEDMAIMWGSKFTANELSYYSDMKIKKLKFMVGDSIGAFKVGVYTSKGVALSELEIPENVITPRAIYTVELPNAVEITGNEDLVLAYSGTIASEKGVIVIDEGPLTEGGSVVSFTNGATWLNLGTINPSYNNYNIFISAMVSSNDDAQGASAPVKVMEKGSVVKKATVKVEREFGVESSVATVAAAPSIRKAPKTIGFNIYRNGELIETVNKYSFAETLVRYGAFTYSITAKFENGWESARSETVTVQNRIAQKAIAPYALTGEESGNNLVLSWQSPDKADVLTYATGNTDLGLGMTGSGERQSYCVIKVPVAELESNVGNKISHIQFGLYSTKINTAAVVVMYGENIVYTQSVPVSSLAVGLNDVRLNEPVEIPSNIDVCVGYMLTYDSGEKPLGMDESAAVAGFGDLISSSATPEYWYSLKNRFNMDHNWRIYAIVSTPDQEIKHLAPGKQSAEGSQSAITYNVYCDGQLIAEEIAEETFTAVNALTGRYYVTAVENGVESGESNVVVYSNLSGVEDLAAGAADALVYVAEAETVVAQQQSDIVVYSAAGALVARADNATTLSLSQLPAGVYVVTAQTAAGSAKAIKIVK